MTQIPHSSPTHHSVTAWSVYYSYYKSTCHSAIYCSLFQLLVTSHLLKVIQYLLTSSSSSFITSVFRVVFTEVTCFRRQFPRNMWPIQLVFFLFIVWGIFFSSLLCVTPLCVSHEQSTRSSSCISELLSEASKVQHHTKQRSKSCNLLITFLNLILICWWKDSSSCWNFFLQCKTWFSVYMYSLYRLLSC
jgi:hypothetical protein